MNREVRVLDGPEDIARAAAEEFTRIATEAVEARGAFGVALAGGATPRGLHALLAAENGPFRARVAWDRVRFCIGDERHVRPAHADSNYRMAWETLLSRVGVGPGRVVRFESEASDFPRIVSHYETMLRALLETPASAVPRLDLVFLGLGADGHTASLFPASEVLEERERLAAAPWVETLGARRFTLTPVVLNAAARVVFLVSGDAKAEALRDVLEGDGDPAVRPARVVRPHAGSVLWLVDREAGRRLRGGDARA